MSKPILSQLSFVRQEYSESDRALWESLLSEPPAVRLMQHGAASLTTHDLVSLVLGTPKDPTIAARLLVELKCIAKARSLLVQELTHVVPGITIDRACRLLAALELSERVRAPREEQLVIKSPADAASVVRDMATLEQEQMRVISYELFTMLLLDTDR
jgi:DNA repair protein RadC